MKNKIIYFLLIVVCILLFKVIKDYKKEPNLENTTAVEETNDTWTCSMHPNIMKKEKGDCPICGMDLIPAKKNKPVESKKPNDTWTCSMHPNIMKKEKGGCPICGMDLIPTKKETENTNTSGSNIKILDEGIKLSNIKTYTISNKEHIDFNLKLSGKIVENEKTNSVQVSYFSGRIEKLYIDFTGKKVKKGQLLAVIYSSELISAQKELIIATDIKETYPDLYKSAVNKLKLWKLTDNQIKSIEEEKEVKEYFPIYANMSGTISEKLIEKGEYVKAGQEMFKIINLKTLWGIFDIYENNIPLIKENQYIEVTPKSYPNHTFKSKISFIYPELNTLKRVVNARVLLNNDKYILKPGMFIDGKLKINIPDINKKIIIPKSSILWTGKRSIVYVKVSSDENIFELRNITLGKRINDFYEIKEGLQIGEEVVYNGAFAIDSEAQLLGKKSMMFNHKKENYLNNKNLEKISFRVLGNCKMCKKTIEKNALINGVANANWDKESKKISIYYDKSKVNVMDIEKSVSESGYDTENIKANINSYKNLPKCCKYDRNIGFL